MVAIEKGVHQLGEELGQMGVIAGGKLRTSRGIVIRIADMNSELGKVHPQKRYKD